MIDRYPSPREIYEALIYNQWPYKTNKDFLVTRDRAFCSLSYIVALRRSEVNRLIRSQFKTEEHQIILEAIKLSKAERHNKKTGESIMRKELYRKEAWIPLEGQRAQLGKIILNYLELLEPEQELFNFSPTSTRPWQIVETYTRGLAGKQRGITPHWLRAYGENWLYDNWEKDLMAVASYVSVDPRTLALYIRKGHMKYKGKV
jgi:hypothetical protein